MDFDTTMEWTARAFELAGVGVLALGGIVAFVRYGFALAGPQRLDAYHRLRQGLGRTILLGLEILIIADIVKTITLETTIDNAIVLAVIVAVRTFLSFSLEIELEGVVPWKRASVQDRE